MKFVLAFLVLQCISFVCCQDPYIESGTEEITVLKGENAVLRCKVRNLGSYTVSWIRQPSDILTLGSILYRPQETRYSVDVTNSGEWVLTIANVTETDTNTYVCDINTSPSTKFLVKVLVAVPAKIDLIEPLEITRLDSVDAKKRIFNETEFAQLFCVTSGVPAPRVSWTRHDGELPQGGTSQDSDTLVFDSLHRDNAGIYECTADNGYGEFDAQEIELVVQYKPTLRVIGDADIRMGPGSRAQLRCVAHANPPPTFTWYKGNVTLTNDIVSAERNSVFTSEYTIARLIPSTDFGQYQCAATNMLGRSSLTISISGQPKAPIINSKVNGLKRNEYTLVWLPPHYGGAPITEYRVLYRRQLVQVGNDTRSQYDDWKEEIYSPSYDTTSLQITLYNLTSSCDYDVRLWGVNAYGEGDKSTFHFTTPNVDIKTTPEPPVIFTKDSVTKTTGKVALVTKNVKPGQGDDAGNVVDASSRLSISFVVLATTIILSIIL
ncbi:protein amalgam-like [Glandiceps talaboti]